MSLRGFSARLNAFVSHPWFRHLRLPFNILLSPIYLWGALLAGGSLANLEFWIGYISLHIFLYGGTTAFNSYYDKDEGPVGGMLHPPPVTRQLLRFSLAVQALGLVLAFWTNASFVLAWTLLFLVFTAYSHPLIRLKADPFLALSAIGLGQGAVGFAAGWLLVRPELGSLSEPLALSGMLTTALIVLGLYIVTQSYQTAEDRARGDRTLPVLLGPRRALLLATLSLGLGGGVMLGRFWSLFGPGWGLALTLFFGLIGLRLVLWAVRFDEAAVRANFAEAMWLASVSSAGLSLMLIVKLLERS